MLSAEQKEKELAPKYKSTISANFVKKIMDICNLYESQLQYYCDASISVEVTKNSGTKSTTDEHIRIRFFRKVFFSETQLKYVKEMDSNAKEFIICDAPKLANTLSPFFKERNIPFALKAHSTNKNGIFKSKYEFIVIREPQESLGDIYIFFVDYLETKDCYYG